MENNDIILMIVLSTILILTLLVLGIILLAKYKSASKLAKSYQDKYLGLQDEINDLLKASKNSVSAYNKLSDELKKIQDEYGLNEPEPNIVTMLLIDNDCVLSESDRNTVMEYHYPITSFEGEFPILYIEYYGQLVPRTVLMFDPNVGAVLIDETSSNPMAKFYAAMDIHPGIPNKTRVRGYIYEETGGEECFVITEILDDSNITEVDFEENEEENLDSKFPERNL